MHRSARWRRHVIPAALALTLSLGFASVAWAAPSWQPTVTLSAPGDQNYGSGLALNAAGDAIVGWTRFTGEIGDGAVAQVASRTACGAFGAPQDIGSTAEGAIDPPSLGMDDAGDAAAAWLRVGTNDGAPQTLVQGVTRSGPTGAWSAPLTLSDGDVDADPGQNTGPELAMDGAGDAVAVWLARSTSTTGQRTFRVEVAMLHAGTWSHVQDIGTTDYTTVQPPLTLSIDRHGDAIVAWESEKDFSIHASYRPAGGSWGAPEDVGTGYNDADSIGVALDGSGNALLTFVHAGATMLTRRPAGGGFGTPVQVSPPGTATHSPGVSMSPDGSAVISWQQQTATDQTGWAAFGSFAGAFAAPVQLTPSGMDTLEAFVIMDDRDEAVALWSISDGSDTSNLVLQTALRPAGGGAFGPPTTLSDPSMDVLVGSIGMAGGSGLAAWWRFDGPPAGQLVYARAYGDPAVACTPPAAPAVLMPAVPPAVTPVVAPAHKPARKPKKKKKRPPMRCSGRREFRIHVRVPGNEVRSIRITLHGHRERVLRMLPRPVAVIDLRGLPKETAVVHISVVLTDGQRLTGVRVYHPCHARLPDHGITL
jgi:hypothetical protein